MKSEGGNTAERPELTHEGIVDAALAIIDEEGAEKLSMRRLGARLKVDPMAIYYYFPNKTALLDGIVDRIMSSIDLNRDDPSRTPEERIYNAAVLYREALLSHPGAILFTLSRPPRSAVAMRPVEALVKILRDAGFGADDTLPAVNIFASYVQGSAIRTALGHGMLAGGQPEHDVPSPEKSYDELTPEEFPALYEILPCAQFIGYEAEFERGAGALIRGLLETYTGKGKGVG